MFFAEYFCLADDRGFLLSISWSQFVLRVAPIAFTFVRVFGFQEQGCKSDIHCTLKDRLRHFFLIRSHFITQIVF